MRSIFLISQAQDLAIFVCDKAFGFVVQCHCTVALLSCNQLFSTNGYALPGTLMKDGCSSEELGEKTLQFLDCG